MLCLLEVILPPALKESWFVRYGHPLLATKLKRRIPDINNHELVSKKISHACNDCSKVALMNTSGEHPELSREVLAQKKLLNAARKSFSHKGSLYFVYFIFIYSFYHCRRRERERDRAHNNNCITKKKKKKKRIVDQSTLNHQPWWQKTRWQ